MLKLNRIMLIGGLYLTASSAYAAIAPELDTQNYYEDSAQIAEVTAGSENGWGWQPANIQARFLCESTGDCDTQTETFDPPSDVAPSVPKSIAVIRKGDSSSVSVQWRGGSRGIGTGFRYELYQQHKGQGRSRVYSGSAVSRVHNPGSNKTVSYSVRACNSGGCSPYATSAYYMVKPTYNTGGAVTKPLENVRPPVNLRLSSGVARTQSSEQETALAALSTGFDALKGEVYGNSCWNTTGEDLISSVQNINDQKYTFKQVDTYESLATSLDVKRSGGGSISFGGFSIGGSGSSSLYSETSKVTESSVIVASFVDKRNRYQAKQAHELGMKSIYENQLINGQDKEFRKACGDKFLDTVTTGRKILFTIRVENVAETYSEIKNKTFDLKASLDRYSADGNFSSSEKSTLEEEFRGYSFEILGTQTGGSNPGNLLRLNSITEFMTVLSDFANSNSQDLVNIESTERDYPLPSALAGMNHFDVFTDYTIYRDILQTWGRLDSQVERRCWMLDLNSVEPDAVGQIEDAMGDSFFQGNVSQRDLCDSTKDMIDRFVNFCANQGEWSKCHRPNSSSCVDSVNNGMCMQRPEMITFKGFKLEERRLDVSRGGCLFGPCNKSASVKQCFSDTSTIPDYSRNAVISESYQTPPVNGMVATIDRAWNVKTARNRITKENNRYCLNASATVFGKGGFGSGGRYESNNQMFGFQTRSLGYAL
ncbi:fibronectin type III domain-containing protein [Alteromonadaceae bacterium M269]|nr:fibronectin type III domain-containing protein [Alteromonadaceae bacterium M269]